MFVVSRTRSALSGAILLRACLKRVVSRRPVRGTLARQRPDSAPAGTVGSDPYESSKSRSKQLPLPFSSLPCDPRAFIPLEQPSCQWANLSTPWQSPLLLPPSDRSSTLQKQV